MCPGFTQAVFSPPPHSRPYFCSSRVRHGASAVCHPLSVPLTRGLKVSIGKEGTWQEGRTVWSLEVPSGLNITPMPTGHWIPGVPALDPKPGTVLRATPASHEHGVCIKVVMLQVHVWFLCL